MTGNTLPIKEDLWGYRKRLQFVVASIDDAYAGTPRSEIGILDVGCGTASLLGMPLAETGYAVTGIDMHEPSIRSARENGRHLENSRFICGTVEELTDDFDVVILSEVLEHVTEPGQLLAGSLLRMKAGGLMIVTVPNGFGEFEWDSWIFRSLGFERLVEKYIERKAEVDGPRPVISSTENADNRHVQFFTLSRLRSILTSAGLEIIKEQASTLMSGPFAGHLFGRFDGFVDWNARAADKLPLAMSSGWFFALHRRDEVTK